MLDSKGGGDVVCFFLLRRFIFVFGTAGYW
jgi:hypothetical protein